MALYVCGNIDQCGEGGVFDTEFCPECHIQTNMKHTPPTPEMIAKYGQPKVRKGYTPKTPFCENCWTYHADGQQHKGGSA